MASEFFVSGAELKVQVDEVYDNILIIINKKNAMKGFLMPVTIRNNVIFDKLLTDCKELNKNYDKDKKPISSFCVPDSTLSQNAQESISDNGNDIFCPNCKTALNKVPKVSKRLSLSREVEKLTHHGFNEDLLKKKNDLSRRVPLKVNQAKIVLKKERTIKKENDVNPNISRPKGLEKFNTKRDSLLATRPSAIRALKTQANEKIMGLCAKRKSIKPLTVERHPSTVLAVTDEHKKPKLTAPRMSDASVYDFVDDDDSESLPPMKSALKIDKRPMKGLTRKKVVSVIIKKAGAVISKKFGVTVTCYEHAGAKFSINDVVWAKIPGYPFWPGHINSFENGGDKRQWKRCRVNWIGWNQKNSSLPLKSLCHFRENFPWKYSPKLKSIKYKAAIELAAKELRLDLMDLLTEAAKKMAERRRRTAATSSKRRKRILDEIFKGKEGGAGDMSQNVCEIDRRGEEAMVQEEDEDTDEEEKARSALITAESLEANNKLSGLIQSQS